MGGSLAKKLKRIGGYQVYGCDKREDAVDLAYNDGVIQEKFANAVEMAPFCDILVICTPIRSITRSAVNVVNLLPAGAWVTDLGSTKDWLVGNISPIFNDRNVKYFPAHPMCGSEKQGYENSSAELYDDSAVVLCHSAEMSLVDPEAYFSPAVKFWSKICRSVVIMDSSAHDQVVSLTSHLPHLLASIISDYVWSEVKKKNESGSLHLLGRGFIDSTRIASGDPNVWVDILLTNKDNLICAIKNVCEKLNEVSEALKSSNIGVVRNALECGVESRREILSLKGIE